MKRIFFGLPGILVIGLALGGGVFSSAAGAATGGVCILRSGNTNMPAQTAPNAGPGYVKTNVAANSFQAAQAQCSDAVFTVLMKQYCATYPGSKVQWGVGYFPNVNTAGPGTVSGCASSGCQLHSCVTFTPIAGGACIIRSDSTSMPPQTAPNAGPGYVKKNVTADSFQAAQAQCSDSIFATLMKEYCAAYPGSKAQWGVAYYPNVSAVGPGTVSGCATSGCSMHACSIR